MYSCTNVVEDCQQRRGLIVEITMPRQCFSEVFDIFTHPTCKQHEIKSRRHYF